MLKELLKQWLTASSPVKINTVPLKEWMTAMKEWMAEIDHPKEASTVKN